MTITEPGIYFTRDGREVTVLEVRNAGNVDTFAVGRYWDEFACSDRFGVWIAATGEFIELVNGAESPASLAPFDIVSRKPESEGT